MQTTVVVIEEENDLELYWAEFWPDQPDEDEFKDIEAMLKGFDGKQLEPLKESDQFNYAGTYPQPGAMPVYRMAL